MQKQQRRGLVSMWWLRSLKSIFLAAFLAALASAQTGSASQDYSEFPGGIRVGGTLSILPFNLLSSETVQTTTSNPVSQTVNASHSTSSPLGGGFHVEAPLGGRIAIYSGILFRGASYNTGTETLLGEDDEDTEEDDRVFTSSLERTRSRYWDIPVIVRFYDSADRAKKVRGFFQAGVSFRHAGSIETYREYTAADGSTSKDETPAQPVNRNITGAVIGAGFSMRGGPRVAFVPEIRYTRWFAPTFEDGPTRSSKNQLELLMSVTF